MSKDGIEISGGERKRILYSTEVCLLKAMHHNREEIRSEFHLGITIPETECMGQRKGSMRVKWLVRFCHESLGKNHQLYHVVCELH